MELWDLRFKGLLTSSGNESHVELDTPEEETTLKGEVRISLAENTTPKAPLPSTYDHSTLKTSSPVRSAGCRAFNSHSSSQTSSAMLTRHLCDSLPYRLFLSLPSPQLDTGNSCFTPVQEPFQGPRMHSHV
ncbi:hypothetical protein IQ07DRAFT_633599 [Pyrenochaeta sp. DS3sAY3a]|nr:hypothetical protein IQ07DRAFT_633599 [Pyrenochaeta sp. DS3sAY3a]